MAVNDRNTPASIGGVIGAAIGGGFGGWLAALYGNTILAGIGGGIGALVGWYVGWRLHRQADNSSRLHRTEARLNVVLGTLCALLGLLGVATLWSSGDRALMLGALLLVLIGSAVLGIGLRRKQ